jgi:hypothetical protein
MLSVTFPIIGNVAGNDTGIFSKYVNTFISVFLYF